MKLLGIILLGILLGTALSAQEDQANDGCMEVPTLRQLEPLTPEEQLVLQQLEAIQKDPEVQEKAKRQAEVPLEAFGGC